MGITSLQVCMDSSDWLQQGLISKENIGGLLDSPPMVTTTPPVDPHDPDILMCGGHPLAAERRLRPHHEQALKCPRCDSTHTKFCYYNNYSLSQPRYFCKACRRYWTKGGTLRNIPVGGGCRKNKKISSNTKKAPLSTSASISPAPTHDPIARRATGSPPLVLDAKSTELQLAFPEQLSFAAAHGLGSFDPLGGGLFFEDVGPGPGPIGSCMGINRYDEGFMGVHQNTNFNGMEIGSHAFGMPAPFDGGINNPAGLNIVESCQRLMMPYDDNAYHGYDHTNNHHHHHDHREADVKPNARVLSLEWHDCISDVGVKDAYGYNIGGLGSWAGLTNGYGSSAMNPLV